LKLSTTFDMKRVPECGKGGGKRKREKRILVGRGYPLLVGKEVKPQGGGKSETGDATGDWKTARH